MLWSLPHSGGQPLTFGIYWLGGFSRCSPRLRDRRRDHEEEDWDGESVNKKSGRAEPSRMGGPAASASCEIMGNRLDLAAYGKSGFMVLLAELGKPPALRPIPAVDSRGRTAGLQVHPKNRRPPVRPIRRR